MFVNFGKLFRKLTILNSELQIKTDDTQLSKNMGIDVCVFAYDKNRKIIYTTELERTLKVCQLYAPKLIVFINENIKQGFDHKNHILYVNEDDIDKKLIEFINDSTWSDDDEYHSQEVLDLTDITNADDAWDFDEESQNNNGIMFETDDIWDLLELVDTSEDIDNLKINITKVFS